MGIYLPNMEMPKSCADCFLEDPYDGYNCRIIPKSANWGLGERPSWCPLVEVPTPHGDLIDKETVRKNLVEELQRNKDPFPYQSYYPSWNDAVMAMLSAPTIIPASEEGE